MRKVLVVDDESDAREFVRAIMEPEGWEVAEAADGVAGLEQARQLKPDLIVLDVQMPEKSGFVVFSELIEDPQTRDCKVVMLTGVREKSGLGFSSSDMGEFVGREPDAYVEKPIDPLAFKRVIKQVMGDS
ncbi:MAG: response regulator [Anaerolineaceae bacterium]|nr:response regulator [Anaerolineaceae bacterium]